MPTGFAHDELVGNRSERRARRNKSPKSPKVARSRTGLGVYAQQRYRPAELIGEIEGEVIDDLEYSSRYCMDLGDSRCLEPAAPFRFVNHSCVPNCTFQWFDIRGSDDGAVERRVFLLARDAIEAGEQLTIDYAWPPAMAIRCQCGEEDCRGWVVDADALADLRALQEENGISREGTI